MKLTDTRLVDYGGTTILEGWISEGIVRGQGQVRRWREAMRAERRFRRYMQKGRRRL